MSNDQTLQEVIEEIEKEKDKVDNNFREFSKIKKSKKKLESGRKSFLETTMLEFNAKLEVYDKVLSLLKNLKGVK